MVLLPRSWPPVEQLHAGKVITQAFDQRLDGRLADNQILGPAAERMAEVICVPSTMAAQPVLVTSALAAQVHFNVHLDDRVYPQSLYMVTMAETGPVNTYRRR